jgi:hypothetical protein
MTHPMENRPVSLFDFLEVERRLTTLFITALERLMSNTTTLTADVAALQTAIASAVAQMNSNFAALQAALAAAGVSDQPAIDAASAALEANIATLNAAATADTPVAPVTAPAPSTDNS